MARGFRGRKLLMTEFSKVPAPKINIQNPTAFPWISNEQAKEEIEKTISLTIASKKMKWIGESATKGGKTCTCKSHSF